MKNAPILTLVVLSSCTIVDASLYKEARDMGRPVDDGGSTSAHPDADPMGPDKDAEPPDGPDAEVDASEPAVTDYADECMAKDTPLLKATTTLTIDTSELRDDVQATEGCTGHRSPGNDAFLAIEVAVNEKWHFHLAATGGGERVANPALYLTQACDTRQCTHVSDRCPDGGDEHFTFVASSKGVWYLGIDDRNAGGGLYSLQAIRATCGDGMAEHGEACDDGNRALGDGCDNLCRRELTGTTVLEVEPNDVPSEANILMISSDGEDSAIVGGQLVSCPIEDLFGVRVKEGESVRATLLDPSQNECVASEDMPELELSLRDAAGTSLGFGSPTSTNVCPGIGADASFAKDLPEGLYFVSVSAPVGGEKFVYKLRVEVVPAGQ